jgi:hypothetical protein
MATKRQAFWSSYQLGLRMGILIFGVVTSVALGFIIDASLGSRDERARYRHFRKLEKRSKDAWLARSGAQALKDWNR